MHWSIQRLVHMEDSIDNFNAFITGITLSWGTFCQISQLTNSGRYLQVLHQFRCQRIYLLFPESNYKLLHPVSQRFIFFLNTENKPLRSISSAYFCLLQWNARSVSDNLGSSAIKLIFMPGLHLQGKTAAAGYASLHTFRSGKPAGNWSR